MRKSWLGYLGFLGLLGLLGLFTSNVGYYGFFGFFGFFSFWKITNDERLLINANKAARNSFIASLFLFIIATIYANIAENLMVYAYCFVLGFALQIVIFSFSL